jgi:16S rRNA C1402 N4-methylase RsmH
MTFVSEPEEDVTTAYDIVNFWSESTIADILYGFADEQYSRRIAHRIIEKRITSPIKTTFELVDVIALCRASTLPSQKNTFCYKDIPSTPYGRLMMNSVVLVT